MALKRIDLNDLQPNPQVELPKRLIGSTPNGSPTDDTAFRVANMPEGALFKGYVLGPVDYSGTPWLVFYHDERRRDVFLARQDDVLRIDRDTDTNVDTVVVRREATVCSTRKRETVELMFLSGTFMTAGEFEQSLGGRGGRDVGIFSPDSPPWCGCGSKTP